MHALLGRVTRLTVLRRRTQPMWCMTLVRLMRLSRFAVMMSMKLSMLMRIWLLLSGYDCIRLHTHACFLCTLHAQSLVDSFFLGVVTHSIEIALTTYVQAEDQGTRSLGDDA